MRPKGPASAWNCTRKEVVFQEKRDFSTGQANFEFTLGEEKVRHKISVTVDEIYALESTYRLGATLSTPSNQENEVEVKQGAGNENAGRGTGGGAIIGTTTARSDEHQLFDIKSEKGSYRLAVFEVEKASRVRLPSITLRVER